MMRTCPEIHHLLFANDSIFFIRETKSNARALKATLEKYSKASRQSINLQKPCIQFGATTREETKEIIKATLGIEMVEDAENYMGIPTN